jgi:hypothetical protein
VWHDLASQLQEVIRRAAMRILRTVPSPWQSLLYGCRGGLTPQRLFRASQSGECGPKRWRSVHVLPQGSTGVNDLRYLDKEEPPSFLLPNQYCEPVLAGCFTFSATTTHGSGNLQSFPDLTLGTESQLT